MSRKTLAAFAIAIAACGASFVPRYQDEIRRWMASSVQPTSYGANPFEYTRARKIILTAMQQGAVLEVRGGPIHGVPDGDRLDLGWCIPCRALDAYVAKLHGCAPIAHMEVKPFYRRSDEDPAAPTYVGFEPDVAFRALSSRGVDLSGFPDLPTPLLIKSDGQDVPLLYIGFKDGNTFDRQHHPVPLEKVLGCR